MGVIGLRFSSCQLYRRHGQKSCCVGPHLGIDLETTTDNLSKLRRILARYWRVFALLDLLAQVEVGFCVEGWTQFAELVDDTTKGPNIGFRCVRQILNEFWRHVERCSDVSCGEMVVSVKQFRKSKISQFNRIVLVEKNYKQTQVRNPPLPPRTKCTHHSLASNLYAIP